MGFHLSSTTLPPPKRRLNAAKWWCIITGRSFFREPRFFTRRVGNSSRSVLFWPPSKWLLKCSRFRAAALFHCDRAHEPENSHGYALFACFNSETVSKGGEGVGVGFELCFAFSRFPILFGWGVFLPALKTRGYREWEKRGLISPDK